MLRKRRNMKISRKDRYGIFLMLAAILLQATTLGILQCAYQPSWQYAIVIGIWILGACMWLVPKLPQRPDTTGDGY